MLVEMACFTERKQVNWVDFPEWCAPWRVFKVVDVEWWIFGLASTAHEVVACEYDLA